MITAARFWDKIADKYARQPVKNLAAYEQTLDRTRAYLGKTSRVLEIGCGTGATALKLAGDAGSITATDITPAMIGIARGRLEDSGIENVGFVCCDATAPDFAKGSFDAVTAFNLLHLLPDAEATVERAYELLKPGGYFISKTACLREMSPLWRPAVAVMQLIGYAPYVRRLRASDVDGMIEAAGFEIQEGRTFTGSRGSWFVVGRKPFSA